MIYLVAFVIGAFISLFATFVYHSFQAEKSESHMLKLNKMSEQAQRLIEEILKQDNFDNLLDAYARGLINFRYWQGNVNEKTFSYHIRSINEAYMQQRKKLNPFKSESNSN
jgi:hypothetical protein